MKKIKRILLVCFWIPILNILCDIGMNYMINLKPEIALARVVFMIIGLAMVFSYLDFKKFKLNKAIINYLAFILILALFASDLNESILDGFAKMFMSLMMIPLGYFAGQIKKDLMIKPMLIVMVLLILNYIFAQIYKTGVSVYDEDSFYTGGASAAAPIILVNGVLILFNSINTNKIKMNKLILIAIISSSIFIVLLSVKRGAILALVIAFLTYIFTSSKKSKSIFFLLLLAGGTAIFIGQYSDVLKSRIEARTTDKNELENENRYKESTYIILEFEDFNIFQVLVGNEAFNSKDCFVKYFGKKRQLHVDYNILLYGTGVVGLVWYLILYLRMYSNLRSYREIIPKLNMRAYSEEEYFESKENISLCYALIVMSLIMSFSGGIQFVSYRVMMFMSIGAYMGAIQANITKYKKINSGI